MTIYLDLTREFNRGRLRAVICSDQAVVLHRLAIMSKDGDWILREDPESLEHVLKVLAEHGAHYRFGAPLDVHLRASRDWSERWPAVAREIDQVPLAKAHEIVVQCADSVLPYRVESETPDAPDASHADSG